jgi:peptide/nickel transport system permease protein
MELKTVKEQMRREHRQLKIRKFIRNRALMIGAVVTVLMILLAALSRGIAPYDPLEIDVTKRLMPPCGAYVFGTDTFGRDVLSRILYGTAISMKVGLVVSVISFIIGLVMGLYSGYYPRLGAVLMRLCDGLKAIPSLILAIALVGVMGAGMRNVILTLSIISIPDIARVARSLTLQVKEQTYIEALRASGAGSMRIIWLNIMPNVISTVLVQVSFIFATAVISEASLSFLGVGIPVPEPSWGNIINEGKTVIFQAWWMVVYPGIFIAASVLGLNLLGEGLRDFLDPLTN